MANITLGLEVTAISILAVFITLYLLAVLINLFQKILAPKKKESLSKTAPTTPDKQTGDSEEELVAVITAAIAAMEKSE